MAKKTQAQKDAEAAAKEALALLEREAELRQRMSSSYDEYVKAAKEAKAIQDALNKNAKIEAEIREAIRTGQRNGVTLTQAELLAENEKLKIIDKQNKALGKQLELYKSAAKEANFMAMALGKATVSLAKGISGAEKLIRQGFGTIKGWGLFELDKAIKQSALSMGVLSKEGVGFRENLKNAQDLTVMIGGNVKELAKLQSSYSESLGRNVVLSKEGLKGLYEMSVVTGLGAEGSSQMAADMELQGYSAERTAEFTEQTLNASSKMGLNATKVMKNIAGNLKLMDKYRFKEGAKGLAKMAQLVTRLGVDMNSVSGMADKLWNIEGAVEMSAQLNVMGGAWAQMADPFHLMYMARNDMKGLTEEIAKASQESISFNNATGEFDMSAEGMHRLKIIAEQTGMEYQDLVTMGKNMAKFDKIKTQVGFSIGGSDEDKAMLDYISNKSMLDKNGDAKIMINGTPKLLSQLTAADKSVIKSQIAQQESMKERAEQARSFDEQLTYAIDNLKVALLPMIESFNKEGGLGDQLDAFVKDFNKPGGWKDTIKYWAGKIGDFLSTVGSWILENKELVLGLWAFAKAVPLILGGFKIISGVMDAVKWFSNGASLGKGFLGASEGLFSRFASSIPSMASSFISIAAPALAGIGAGWLGGEAYDAVVGEKKKDDTWSNNWGKKLGRLLTTTAAGAGAGAAVGSLGAGVGAIPGAVIGGIGGLGKGLYDEFFGEAAEDAYFNAPVKDGFFRGGSFMNKPVKDGIFRSSKFINRPVKDGLFDGLKGSLLKALIPGIGPALALKEVMSTRGVVQNGKITPIDGKDDLVALKKGGAIDKYGQSSGGGGNTVVKHEFGSITIDGTIRVEGPGGQEINKNLLNDESFKRQLTKIVQDETIKRVSYGKMKG